MKNAFEKILGFVLMAVVLYLGISQGSGMLFFRLLVGLSLGYALTRGYMGFAGSVNRAYQTGSTKLMRHLMLLFVTASVVTAGLLMFKEADTLNLWVNPINLGLILGGLLFGYGMAFSTCCASGVLTDIVTEFPKAMITLIFFGMGVFLGFPIQSGAAFVRKTWLSTATYADRGVFFPDLFKSWDPTGGFFGALVLTAVLALIVVKLSLYYERKRAAAGTLGVVPAERAQASVEAFDASKKHGCGSLYDFFFVRPWSMKTAIFVIVLMYTLLLAVTKNGWGASTPYGIWFGKLLMLFGVSAEALAEFSTKKPEFFTLPFFQHPVTVQNVGIMLGTLFYMLSAGKLFAAAKAAFKIRWWELLLFAMGGLTMGLGTRLSNGCNVGALFTPIANFSLAGWLYLIFITLGAIVGNRVGKAIYAKKAEEA